MFKSVFYSQTTRTYGNYAKAFKDRFPTVTEIIYDYKNIYKSQCEAEKLEVYKKGKLKTKIQLSHKLMQIESKVFQKTLSTLYKNKNFKGICIHDAIAVFDNSIDTQHVIKVLYDSYSQIGVYPTFSS